MINTKKILPLYIGLLAITVILMVMLYCFNKEVTTEQLPRDYEQIREEGVLRVAIEYNSNSYYVSGDSLAGEDYELCKQIERKSGLKVDIYPEMNLNNSLDGLRTGRVDIVARDIPITITGKEDFRFTEPVNRTKYVLVQRIADANDGIEPLRNQLELGGKTIYIQQGSPARLRIQNLSEEMADSIHLKEDPLYGEEQLIILVAKGEIDYAICGEITAQKLASFYPAIDFLTAISFTQ